LLEISVTGKVFYWSNAGGLSLYWMATPVAGEWGDWLGGPTDARAHSSHQDFFNQIRQLSAVQKDEALQREAIHKIMSHPKKFAMNLAANAARMFFSYPYSYTPQKLSTLFYIVPNMFLLVILTLLMYPAVRNGRALLNETHPYLFWGVVTFLITVPLSAYPRMLFPLIPVFLLFMAFTLDRFVRIEVKGTELERG